VTSGALLCYNKPNYWGWLCVRLERVLVERELTQGEAPRGEFYAGDVQTLAPALLEKYAGKAQLIYLDPPFLTGETFVMRTRVGEKDWKKGTGSLVQTAYRDDLSPESHYALIRSALETARALLSESGVLFLHVDSRTSARARLIADEIFGEANFLNEIIWAYQTGGRARRYFSRKHDNIFFYRKGRRYFFNISAVPIERSGTRRNHMKRHVDTDGRVYRSIRSGGKIYTYYDDDPAYPGDVWDDVSHLQQKDPQRTGYDTQKPLSLMTRIVRCASRPGDLVMDLFAGSGTTLEAARLEGRRFVGVDLSPLSHQTVRKRLMGAQMLFEAPPSEGDPAVRCSMLPGVGFYEISLDGYDLEKGLVPRTLNGLDAVDNWGAGYIRGGAFHLMAREERTAKTPALTGRLSLPVFEGTPVVRIGDVLGRNFYYALHED
jgi:site-specific DNA-methyltransferase (adenine-specific)